MSRALKSLLHFHFAMGGGGGGVHLDHFQIAIWIIFPEFEQTFI